MAEDYVLDYALGTFVLWNKVANYEVDISEQGAMKWSNNNNCHVTQDAQGALDTMCEDLAEHNEIFNGVGL